MKTYKQRHDFVKYSDHWSTPAQIYDHYVHSLGYLDPCKLFDSGTDLKAYDVKSNMFINPPYSHISEWVRYAVNNSYYNGIHVVLLIPSRTDTRYFHELLQHGCVLEFIKGRLHFGGSKNSAPFPSVLVHLNEKI